MRSAKGTYLTLLGFLVIGAIGSWYVLWPLTYDESVARCYVGHESYHAWAFGISVALGILGGVAVTSISLEGQLKRAFAFSVVSLGIGFILRQLAHPLMDDVYRFDAFCVRHPRLGNATYWLYYWSDYGLRDWLLPQMVAQVLATAAILRLQSRRPTNASRVNDHRG
jgi:hypothetical protein